MSDFIGRGWAFPLHADAAGDIAMAEREHVVERSIRLILGTAYGERPMRPEFGCGIHDHVFGSVDVTTAGQLAYEVRASLERWEPRIDLEDVGVLLDPDNAGVVYIDIRYTLRGSYDLRNLVFPFYVIPEEG